MPTRSVVLTDHEAAPVERLREGLRLIESRDAEEKARLKALREAVQLGISDIDAGRLRSFESSESLARYLASVTDNTLPEKTGRRSR